MLYRPEAFEPLVDTPWSELRARAAVRDIDRSLELGDAPDSRWLERRLEVVSLRERRWPAEPIIFAATRY